MLGVTRGFSSRHATRDEPPRRTTGAADVAPGPARPDVPHDPESPAAESGEPGDDGVPAAGKHAADPAGPDPGEAAATAGPAERDHNDPDPRAVAERERVWAQTFAVLTSTPRWVRALGRGVLREWGLDPIVETVELVLSELVTNAVKISDDGGAVRVVVRAGGGRVRVEVGDGSTGRPRISEPEPDAEGGRGLLLVAAVGAGWGTYPVHRTPGGPPAGKVVWCEISIPGD